jgi:hypothetical protein
MAPSVLGDQMGQSMYGTRTTSIGQRHFLSLEDLSQLQRSIMMGRSLLMPLATTGTRDTHNKPQHVTKVMLHPVSDDEVKPRGGATRR